MAVVAALVTGTGIALRQARVSARERDWAVEQLRRAEATNDFSAFLLSQARPAGRPISNKELLARGEGLIDARFAADPVLRAHMLLVLADRDQENQQFDDWRRVLDRAHDVADSIGDVDLRARVTCNWAMPFVEKRDFARVLQLIEGAEASLPAGAEHADVEAGCRVLESTAAKLAGDVPRAVRAAERAVSLEDSRGGGPARQLDAYSALASAYARAFRYADADRAFRRTAELLDSQGLGSSLQAAMHFSNWSAVLQDWGRYVEAARISARLGEQNARAKRSRSRSITYCRPWAPTDGPHSARGLCSGTCSPDRTPRPPKGRDSRSRHQTKTRPRRRSSRRASAPEKPRTEQLSKMRRTSVANAIGFTSMTSTADARARRERAASHASRSAAKSATPRRSLPPSVPRKTAAR